MINKILLVANAVCAIFNVTQGEFGMAALNFAAFLIMLVVIPTVPDNDKS